MAKIWLARDKKWTNLYTIHIGEKPTLKDDAIYIGNIVSSFDGKVFHSIQKRVRLRRGQCVEIANIFIHTKDGQKRHERR
ncbi:MAG: hypothetical protein ABIG61_07420 [Planctomycetota bacterium]